MTELPKNEHALDNQFADFTDQILAIGTTDEKDASLSADPELRALEQTALRLKNAFGKDDPSEAVIHRMRRNITTQWQKHKSQETEPFWKKWELALNPSGQKWHSQRSRQRLSMAFTLAILLVVMLISAPLMKSANIDQPAASGHSLNAGILVAIGGLILLVILFTRRRQ